MQIRAILGFAVLALAIGVVPARAALSRIQEIEKLANEDDVQAMTTLGLIYHQGNGVKQDYGRAIDWYMKAIEKGDGDAFNNLGVMYRDGLGVQKNQKVAYLIFLAVHMQGMGDEDTQFRAGQNLERMVQDLPKEELHEALSYTWAYVVQILKSRGKDMKIGADVLPAQDRPRIRDNGWWLDSEQAAMTFKSPPPWDKAPPVAPYVPLKSFQLLYEVRGPKSQKFDPLTKFDVVTDRSASGTRLQFAKRSEEGGYVVFAKSTLVFSGEKRRALVIGTESGSTVIFLLKVPSDPKIGDWSEWQKPDYLGDEDAVWAFMHDQKKAVRSKAIPADCFEIRYRVEAND